jgi:hypothetical protein
MDIMARLLQGAQQLLAAMRSIIHDRRYSKPPGPPPSTAAEDR